MVINGNKLLRAAPIKDMLWTKCKAHGVSHGLTEVGYDIRLKQEVRFYPDGRGSCEARVGSYETGEDGSSVAIGRFAIASAIEEFQMPDNLTGVVHDKSTWARVGLSVFNTVIEPGWKGFLTLELVYHGNTGLIIPAGAGIAQVMFHELALPARYDGKYQNQEDRPVDARHE